MPKRKGTHQIIIWADSQQEHMLREAADAGGLHIVGVGSDAPATAAALASTFDCERLEDLRQSVHRDEAHVLWIAADVTLDQPTIKLIHESGRLVAVSQPQPGAIGSLPEIADALRTVHPVPLMRRSPGFRQASELLDEFGRVECANVSFRSKPGEPALYSRLFDAMDVINSLCGTPEIVDAGLAVPGTDKPEMLAGLSGHMTINLRFADDRCACIAISDRAGAWFRGVTVLGEGGCLRINDLDYEWRSVGGEIIEANEKAESFSAGTLCGLHIQRLIEQRDSGEVPADMRTILGLCESARLSSRTGEGEDPRKVMQMLTRP